MKLVTMTTEQINEKYQAMKELRNVASQRKQPTREQWAKLKEFQAWLEVTPKEGSYFSVQIEIVIKKFKETCRFWRANKLGLREGEKVTLYGEEMSYMGISKSGYIMLDNGNNCPVHADPNSVERI